MALIDKASLLMVPSTYEAGKLYNVLPSGNRAPDNKGGAGYDQTRADFDFDRGTDHAATRIGSDGLIKKYRENLLLYSQDFSNGNWSKSNLSLTSNQADPFGETNAFLFTSTSTASNLFVQSLSNQNKVCSIYAKAGNRSVFAIVNNAYGNGATFDLSAETATSSGQGSLAVIESVGNDWYRCSVYFSLGTQFLVVLSDVNGNGYSNGDTISFFGAQLETGLVATDVLTSGATTAKAGVLVDLPRINYDANGENGALLLEPSRVNAIQYSEYFGAWTNNAYDAITPNSTTSPEGIDNAYLIETSNNNAGIYVVPSTSLTIGDKLTISVFLKAKSGSNSDIVSFGIGGPAFAGDRLSRFDLSDGTINYENPDHDDVDIQPYGNGWYRCIITDTAVATGVFTFVVYGYGTNCDWYAYGAQAEPSASYSTSYIPNHGESGGVTRAADSCSVTGASDVIGQTEGTIFADLDLNLAGSNIGFYGIQVYDSGFSTTYGKAAYIELYQGKVYGYVRNVTIQCEILSGIYADGQNLKIALAYKENDFALYVNGVQIGVDTSGTLPSTLNSLALHYSAGTQQASPLHQAILFKERLTNAELATLTTL